MSIALISCKEKPPIQNDQADYSWQFLGLPGSQVFKLHLEDEHLYAGATSSGLWRLNVNKLPVKWDSLGLGDTQIWSIIVDKSTNTIFVGTTGSPKGMPKSGIWKSTNNGMIWIPSDNGIPSPSNSIQSMARDPLNPEIMFAHCNYGLYKSTDKGKNWKYINDFAKRIEDIEFFEQNPDTIWIGGESNALYSVYYSSENGGETWTFGTARAVRNTLAIFDIEFAPNNSSVVYIGTLGEFLKTTDYGTTWDTLLIPIGWGPPVSVNNISLNPSNSQELFATGRYLYHSIDGGKNFENINYPTGVTSNAYPLVVDWKKRVLYIGILDVGIYKKRF